VKPDSTKLGVVIQAWQEDPPMSEQIWLTKAQLYLKNSRRRAQDTESSIAVLSIWFAWILLPAFWPQIGHGSSREGSTDTPQALQFARTIMALV
jgi:hypothetical protein